MLSLHGDMIVSNRRNFMVLFLLCATLTVLIGCGSSGDDKAAPTASINTSSAPAAEGASRAPAASKADSDPQHPVVQMETSLGKLTVRLDAEKAPLTVSNFLSYVDAGQYDQTIIHQIYKGQGFLAGGFGANKAEKPSRTPVRNEADNGLKNRRGTISMVRQPGEIDSATCQFLVNVADNQALDHKDRTPDGYGYCVFGEVIEGLDVIDSIANAQVHDTPEFERTPVQAIVVSSVKRIR